MKKTLAFFTLLLGCVAMFAQSGPTFPYQAVVRNSHNQLIKDSTFAIGVEVYQSADLKFSETQSVTTNANGQFTMNIGGGTWVSGAMADVTDWSAAKFKLTYHLSEGDIISENAVSPVPYALQAANTAGGNFLTSDSAVITTMQDNIMTNTTNIATNAADIAALANRVNTFNTNVCDSVKNCVFSGNTSIQNMLNELSDLISAQNQKIDSLAKLVASQDSAINSLSNQMIPFNCGTSKVKDVDNNTYNTVQIGNQCWMTQNLRTKTHQYGNVWTKTDVDSAIYGLYYDWAAVMQGESGNKVQGICPTGWHVPSDAEWDTLTTYVNSVADYKCGGTNNYIAKALASKTGWNNSENSCAVGNNLELNNATGFSAVPSGYYSSNNATCFNFGDYALLWSATEGESGKVRCRELNKGGYQVHSTNEEKNYGYSVRCVRNADAGGNTPSTPATMSCEDVMNCLGDTLGRLNARITSQGAEIETLNGTVASQASTITSQANTIASLTHIVDSLSNHTPDTLTSDTTAVPFNCGIDKVKDVDGNEYSTIQIGNQCWMKENLRTTTSQCGRVKNANDICLYDWAAAMQVSGANDASITVGVKHQGICPVGWHVPSDEGWDALTEYVSRQSEYQCGSESTNIAKALSSKTGWNYSGNSCAVGNIPEDNDATGFSAVPVGAYYGESLGVTNIGNGAYMWSSTQYSSSKAWYRLLGYGKSNVVRSDGNKGNCYSVRCLKNN